MSEAAPASRAATGAISHSSGAFWRQVLTPYAQSHLGRSLLDIATSVIPYLVLSVVMYLALGVSYPLVLAIAVPTAGFWYAPSSSSTTVLTVRSWHPSAPTHGLAWRWDCWSTPHFCVGATSMRSTTPHPETWTGAVVGTSAR